ncbi:MAG: head GIN domain-containing protein [Bacteroidota bacterium]|nr:head GIN domain-containing protein [Bacteroidota bacterium]
MNILSTITLSLVAVITFGCNAAEDGLLFLGEGVAGSGTPAKDVRSFSALRGVHLATIGDLRVEKGDRDELLIEADDNLLKYFTTRVEDGVLRIDTEDGISIRPRKDVRYHLITTSLELLRASSSGDITAKDCVGEIVEVHSSSSGDITVRDIDATDVQVGSSSSGDVRIVMLQAQSLEARLSSSGDVTIRDGSVEQQEVRVSSSGDYDAAGIRSQRATVRTSSSGDIRVWAVDKLRASTSSSGSVRFRGNPDVEAHSSSSGDIERIP